MPFWLTPKSQLYEPFMHYPVNSIPSGLHMLFKESYYPLFSRHYICLWKLHQIPFWIIYRNITWTAQTLYIFRHLASIAYSSYLLNPWSKAENVNLHEYMNMMSIQLFMNKKMTALTLYYMYIWHSLFRFTLVYTILNIYIWMHHSNMQSAADYIIIGMFNACHNRNMD